VYRGINWVLKVGKEQEDEGGLRSDELHDYRPHQMLLLGVVYRKHAAEEKCVQSFGGEVTK